MTGAKTWVVNLSRIRSLMTCKQAILFLKVACLFVNQCRSYQHLRDFTHIYPVKHFMKSWGVMNIDTMDWMKQSKSFNKAADYYDVFRPSYPSEVIGCIEANTSLHVASKILEIGAGSGKATELFLNRGYELLCIEPGAQLAEIGVQKHRDKKLQYVVTRFEDWEEPRKGNDLVFSAQAYHWVPQPEGYKRCAEVLKPNGHLALFWNFYLCGDSKLDKEVAELCNQYHAFTISSKEEIDRRINSTSAEISNSGYFEAPSIYKFPWSHKEDVDSFIGFLNTTSSFLVLSKSEQNKFIAELRLLFSNNGGVVCRYYICCLFISSRKLE